MLKKKQVTVNGKRVKLDLEFEGRNAEDQRIYSATDHAYSDYLFIEKIHGVKYSSGYDPGRVVRANLPHKNTKPQRGK